jgi:NADPH-dependent curcumin reductase
MAPIAHEPGCGGLKPCGKPWGLYTRSFGRRCRKKKEPHPTRFLSLSTQAAGQRRAEQAVRPYPPRISHASALAETGVVLYLRNEREDRTHDLTDLLRGHANIPRAAPSVETRSTPEPDEERPMSSQITDRNRRIVLASRPKGAPTSANFRLEDQALPAPAGGQVLLRTIHLSLDPYMRGRMNDEPSYVPPIGLGEVMPGATVSRVATSRLPDYEIGDWVLANAGWQDYALSDGTDLRRLGALAHPTLALGVLGMPGFTAYVGLLDIGQPRPGETVVVAAATGAVGAVVGQIAKREGCRVVGIAGGPDKCRWAVQELGFDACVDHRRDNLAGQLEAACPKGIDVYFENVGGAVFDAVMPLLNVGSRVPLCGLIAHYNDTAPTAGPDRMPLLITILHRRRIKMQGFFYLDSYADRHAAFLENMSAWVADGSVRYREDVVEGLENAPSALIGLLDGKNFGKLVVRVGDD